MYKGPGWQALHCSHKTVVAGELGETELYELVKEGLRGLERSLPARTRDESAEQRVVSAAMRLVAPGLVGFNARRVPYPDEPGLAEIRVLRERFRDQIISEIDKERGELAVLCAVSQYRVMESAFPRGGTDMK